MLHITKVSLCEHVREVMNGKLYFLIILFKWFLCNLKIVFEFIFLPYIPPHFFLIQIHGLFFSAVICGTYGRDWL